jgi:ABC-type branched-chain amino acid transport system, permease component
MKRAFNSDNLTLPTIILIGVLFALVPILSGDTYLLHICILVLMFGALASSWNLINGYAGIFSFGHQAFFGAGAYASSLLALNFNISPWLTIWLAGFLTALLGIVVSLPVMRIRSVPHIAIVTLAFAEIVRITCSNLTGITRGELGLNTPALPGFSLPLVGDITFTAAHKTGYLYVILMLWLFVMLVTWSLLRSRFGYGIRAIRSSQIAAESLGVSLVWHKTAIFALSSFLAGIIGAFYGHYILVLTPASALGMDIMVQVIAITLIGGIGYLLGPTLGAVLLIFGLEYLRGLGGYQMLVYGALLLVIVMFLPGGLASLKPGRSSSSST